MADPITVQSLRWHTYNGLDRPEGVSYQIDPTYPETLETLEALGMAKRVSTAVEAPPAKKEPPPPAKKK